MQVKGLDALAALLAYPRDMGQTMDSTSPSSARNTRATVRLKFLVYRSARVCFVTRLRGGVRAGLASLQQAHNSSQGVPGCLVQCRVRPDEVADHLPSSNVQGALGWWSHSQGDGARGAETDPPCPRLLPRSYSYGLREHEYANGFVSRFELPITAKTTEMFQGPLLAASCRNQILSSRASG